MHYVNHCSGGASESSDTPQAAKHLLDLKLFNSQYLLFGEFA